MYFDKKGSGPAVVLIHGLGACSFSWRHTVAALSEHHTTYAVDLLGFGQSPAPEGFPCTMAAQAEAVTALMKEQSLSNPIVIGHSMGGGVCLYLAKQTAPDSRPSLSRMVLVAPVASPPPPVGDNLAVLSAMVDLPDFDAPSVGLELAKNVLRRAYADFSLVTPEQISGYAKGLSSRDQIRAFIKHSSTLNEISFPDSKLGEIAVEALIIWGKQDPFLDIARGERLARALPKASLQRIDGCGHIPQEESPAVANSLIVEFLK